MPFADIIVPVFNEAEILEEFYQRTASPDLNLIFVDNASTDDSVRIIESWPDVTLIRHDKNQGYGGSLIDGMRAGNNENIIIIDADCEYPPEAIPALLESLQNNDVVYTSRFLGKLSAAEANMPYMKLLGNRIISGLYNQLFGQHTTDLYTGCKAYKRHCIEGMPFKHQGFEHVLELACRLSQRGYKIVDIPVDFAPRRTGTSKMSHVSETLKFISLLLLFRLSLRGAAPPGTSS